LTADGEVVPRHLSLVDATALFVGIILGSGIFVAPAAVAGATSHPLPAVALWLAGAFVAACGAFCYAECAARMPRNGGFFVFHREAYGPGVAFVGAWASIFVTYPASIAAIALVCARYLGEAAGIEGHERLIGAAALVAAGVVNAAGLRTGPRAQVILTTAKVGAIAVLGFGALAALAAHGGATTSVAVPAAPARLTASAGLTALLVLLWSYDGWSDVTLVAGEVKNPGRNIGRAVVFGTLILFGVYALVQIAVLVALPPSVASSSARPFSDAVAVTLGPSAARGVAALVVVSTFGSILGVILAVARLAVAMSRGGAFLPWFSALTPKGRTPARATAAMTAASCVYLASGGFREILAYFTFSVWIFYGLTAVALLILRRRGVGEPVAWRAPGGFLPPAVVLMAGSFLTVRLVAERPASAAAGAAMIALGVPAYALMARRRRLPSS
jgi:basic amino acid/polyamine antiporter, APA family